MTEILGIGQDLINVDRIARVVAAKPRFVQRIASPIEEQSLPTNHKRRILAIAKTFAAKEACFKAIGTGLTEGMNWHDLEISRNTHGAPTVSISRNLSILIAQHHQIDTFHNNDDGSICHKNVSDDTGTCRQFRILLTISDEPPHAIAAAVLLLR